MSNLTELNPLIYPARIWVGFNISDKDLADEFWGLNENDECIDIGDNIIEDNGTTIARCSPVAHKQSGWRGVILNIVRPKQFTAGVMAHEAEHIVCWMCEQFGINSTTFDDSEPRAYLMQWLVDEIAKISKQSKKQKPTTNNNGH